MKKIKFDANGIPVLDELEIEELAEERFLRRVAPAVLDGPTFLPLGEVMARLQSDGFVTFDFHRDLGTSPEGYKYLGCFDLVAKRISIDASLSDDDPRFPFTVAHELGHFYLHGKVRWEAISPEGSALKDSTRELVVHRVESGRPRSLLEWQANRFAAAVLMPRCTLRAAVTAAQQDMGITRNLGFVWMDGHAYTRRDYETLVLALTRTYLVSRAVVRIRLAELGIARERVTPEGPMHIGDILAAAMTIDRGAEPE